MPYAPSRQGQGRQSKPHPAEGVSTAGVLAAIQRLKDLIRGRDQFLVRRRWVVRKSDAPQELRHDFVPLRRRQLANGSQDRFSPAAHAVRFPPRIPSVKCALRPTTVLHALGPGAIRFSAASDRLAVGEPRAFGSASARRRRRPVAGCSRPWSSGTQPLHLARGRQPRCDPRAVQRRDFRWLWSSRRRTRPSSRRPGCHEPSSWLSSYSRRSRRVAIRALIRRILPCRSANATSSSRSWEEWPIRISRVSDSEWPGSA